MGKRQNKFFEIARRRRLVASLYVRGATQEEIGERLKISQATVSRDLSELRKGWAAKVAERGALILLEAAKLDDMERQACQRFADERETKKADVWFRERLRLMERRAKLLGLDQPERLNVSVGELDAEIERELARQRVQDGTHGE